MYMKENRRPIVIGKFAFIELSAGLVAKIDAADAHIVDNMTWTALKRGRRTYAGHLICSENRWILMHRILVGLGPDDRKIDVDHIDCDGLNNTRENLRTCTRSQNLMNMRKRESKCSTIYKGVCFDKARGKFLAYVNKDGKRKNIGRFDTEELACDARDKWAKEMHGEFANLNKLSQQKP